MTVGRETPKNQAFTILKVFSTVSADTDPYVILWTLMAKQLCFNGSIARILVAFPSTDSTAKEPPESFVHFLTLKSLNLLFSVPLLAPQNIFFDF